MPDRYSLPDPGLPRGELTAEQRAELCTIGVHVPDVVELRHIVNPTLQAMARTAAAAQSAEEAMAAFRVALERAKGA